MKLSRGLLPLLSLLLLVSCQSKQNKNLNIPVTEVRQGTFYIDLHEEGEIKSTQSIQVSAPEISWRYGNNLKIATLIEDGTAVEAGDTLMTFDPSEVRKAILDAQQRLELSYAELEKMKAQHENSLEGQISDFEVSKISLEITRLNLESAQYEADITRQEIQLNLEQAEISLQQAEEQIENTRRTQGEELYQKQLSIRQSEKELQDAMSTVEKLVVKAPNPGIVMIRTNYSTQAKYQEGESVWSGQAMIELPNLRELKVELKVNEVDISKVKKGLKVMIRPDAFADSTYWGEIQTVANLAVNKSNNSKIKVFPVEVLVTSPVNQDLSKDPELMPGLTVSCRIIVDEIPNQIFIPITALFEENGRQVVYVKTAGGFRTKEVETGERNTDYVIIKDGLKAKDEVALMYPYADLEDSKKQNEEAAE